MYAVCLEFNVNGKHFYKGAGFSEEVFDKSEAKRGDMVTVFLKTAHYYKVSKVTNCCIVLNE